MQKQCPDHYSLQRLALLPAVIDPLSSNSVNLALAGISETELQQIFTFIIEQDLYFFWENYLHSGTTLALPDSIMELLREQCFKGSIRYLAQKKTVLELDNLFAVEKIRYAVIKGVHIREVVYATPAYRPSIDIDILIHPSDKYRTVHTLCVNGYSLISEPANISHEVSLTRDNVQIDLHWHIMRPGRTRIELTELFLQSRQRCNFFWALDQKAVLLILLTHPVFTKYSTAPRSSLVRLIDLKRWIETQQIDWNKLLKLLEDAGMKTAAWITASHLTNLTGCQLPEFFLKATLPANPKRFLLTRWLDLNLSSRLANYPILAKYIFTLLAHDRFSDIVRFIRIFKDEQKKEQRTMDEFQQASQYN
jgi:hypothetical protein